MKNKFLTTVLFILLTNFSYGQEKGSEKEYKTFGIGISLVSLDLINYDAGVTSANRVYVPINVSKGFRIEPEFSVSIYDGYVDKFFNAGLGFLKMKRTDNFNFIYGLRAGATYFIGGQEISPYAAPIISGEYYLAKQFSMGAEVQFKTIVGSSTSFYTVTMLQLRFYP